MLLATQLGCQSTCGKLPAQHVAMLAVQEANQRGAGWLAAAV